MTDPADLPSGTVTFLFTDLEGSTRLLEAHPRAYREAVARHHALLRGAVEAHGGAVFETVGDAVYAAFGQATDALAAALAGQRALRGADWGDLGAGALAARMALHTGEVERRGAHYFGAALHRAGRLLPAAHGGQVVLSGATAGLVQDALPAGAALRDLGAHRLKDLQRPERVFQLLDPALPEAFPPLRALDAQRHNLPAQPTAFTGREGELAAVRARLLRDGVRLLTLTGPGGVGKTRLALQAAADALAAAGPFRDGAWFVELAPLADEALVPQAVAAALGVREVAGRPVAEALRDHLRDRRLLLVLDNCEHLLPAAAAAAAALLAACPGLTVLATSRAALRLTGEHQLAVPPLSLPEPGRPPPPEGLLHYEAPALFVQRAAAARADFAVTPETAPAVVEICRRLDGLPLAIELAAARVTLLPPQALLVRLASRLALLTGGPRDAPARQQTLRATLDWSHALLGAGEQALFRRLAVFVGGCTLEAAEAVCNAGADLPFDVLEGLASLVDNSLLRQEDAAGAPRFAMLETVREHALERLRESGEADAARQAHAAHFLAVAERAAREEGAEWRAGLERLERERDNLRAALRHAAGGARSPDPEAAERGLRLAVALADFWYARGPVTEGRGWLAALLAGAGDGVDAVLRADALLAASELSAGQDDLAEARAECAEALAIYRRLGDKPGAARALLQLALLARERGEPDAARPLLEESRGLGRELGDAHGIGLALTDLAVVARLQGRYAEARTLLEEALALRQAADDRSHVADSLCQLGLVACAQGDAAAARALLHQATALRRDLQEERGLAESLEAHAALAAAQAQPGRALRLAGAAGALREANGWWPWPSERRQAAEWLRPARQALGDEAAAAALAAGRAMTLEQAVAYALEDTPAAT